MDEQPDPESDAASLRSILHSFKAATEIDTSSSKVCLPLIFNYFLIS
jgi:hypothetical protein